MGRSLPMSLHSDSTVNKTGPTGPSFVAPGLLFSRVAGATKKDIGKLQLAQNTAAWLGLRTGQHAGPWMYTER